MPSLAMIEAATPKCPGPSTNLHLLRPPCSRPMRWSQEHNAWECEVHGRALAAELLVSQHDATTRRSA